MLFRNREDAARRLAQRLIPYRGKNPLILAIPRGAVPMAKILADALEGEMDIVLVRKLAAPNDPELAIGAVDESGQMWLDPSYADVTSAYLAAEAERQRRVIVARRALYTPHRVPADPEGRAVIVVDDGLATGATMRAALRAVRAHKPARLMYAAPVASAQAVLALRKDADEMIVLDIPENFVAVSQFYEDFRQVEDDEVVRILDSPGRSPLRQN